MEIFPYRYFRKTYFPLSRQFGIHHFWTQNIEPAFYYELKPQKQVDGSIGGDRSGSGSGRGGGVPSGSVPSSSAIGAYALTLISQERCMTDLLCRSYARSMNINMAAEHVQLVLATVQDIETGAIGEHNAPSYF